MGGLEIKHLSARDPHGAERALVGRGLLPLQLSALSPEDPVGWQAAMPSSLAAEEGQGSLVRLVGTPRMCRPGQHAPRWAHAEALLLPKGWRALGWP